MKPMILNHANSEHLQFTITMSTSTIDVAWMERDLYGYGPDRPNADWPNGKKIAVNCELVATNYCGTRLISMTVVLNHEEGGERSCEDGDEHAETVLHEFGQLVFFVASDLHIISADETS